MSSTARAAGGVTPNMIIIGDETDDSLYGGSGNDTLNGRDGNDYLSGGAGNDTLIGGAGTDLAFFEGYAAEYTITLDAGTGRYTVTSANPYSLGTDSVSGVEYFRFYDGTMTAAPKQPGAVVRGSATEGDTLQGGTGDDSLYADDSGVYRMIGGPGNDMLYSGKGGSFTAVFSGNASEYSITRDPLYGFLVVTDSLAGRDGRDTMSSSIITLAFADTTLTLNATGFFGGTDGDDILTGSILDEAFQPKHGNDLIDGGDGVDRVVLYGRYAEYVVSFDSASGHYTVTDKVSDRDGVDLLSNIEVLEFYDARVPIGVSPGGQVVVGNGESDALFGGPGNDSLYTSKAGGNDSFTGGGGDDALDGLSSSYSGTATAVFSGPYADYMITYDANKQQYTVADKVSGRDGTDYLRYIDLLQFADATLPIATSPGGQTLTGGSGPNTLTGGSGHDSLSGGGGNDRLTGAGGVDVLLGGAGTDRLDGGAGDDWLNGGLGNDVLIGRGGSDTAVFQGNLAEYQIVHNAADNTYQVTDTIADRDGVDTVHSTEFLQFADGTHPIGATPTVGLLGVVPDSFDFGLA